MSSEAEGGLPHERWQASASRFRAQDTGCGLGALEIGARVFEWSDAPLVRVEGLEFRV